MFLALPISIYSLDILKSKYIISILSISSTNRPTHHKFFPILGEEELTKFLYKLMISNILRKCLVVVPYYE